MVTVLLTIWKTSDQPPYKRSAKSFIVKKSLIKQRRTYYWAQSTGTIESNYFRELVKTFESQLVNKSITLYMAFSIMYYVIVRVVALGNSVREFILKRQVFNKLKEYFKSAFLHLPCRCVCVILFVNLQAWTFLYFLTTVN